MNLREACNLAYKVPPEIAFVEGIVMASPPSDRDSYVVQVRTHGPAPQVYWLGPDKKEAYEKKDEINNI